MSKQENKAPMTEYDNKVVAHLKNLISLRKAGKLKYLTHDSVFGKLKLKIIRAEKQKMASDKARIAQAEVHQTEIFNQSSSYAANI